MSKEKWTEAKTRQFVLSYLQKPTLWNSGMPEYCQKKEKERAYRELMDEFGLTLPEVRNKIRIFRTTYNQEKKKEDTILNYKPRLNWYGDMKNSFESGKIKTFSKIKSDMKKDSEKIDFEYVQSNMKKENKKSMIEFEYEHEDINEHEEIDDDRPNSSNQQIIIEPYDEYEIEQEDQEIEIVKKDHLQSQQSNAQQHTLLSSNELFLYSLKSSLDKLSEEKNMRARIDIQEVLYKIMYEK